MAIYDDKTGIRILDSQVPFVSGKLPASIEKRYMNPIRYRTNYRIVPAFVMFCAVCLILVLVLGAIDDQKFMAVMIALFGLMAVAAVCLLLTVPKTREKELALERERYDFDISQVEDMEAYEMELEDLKLKFSENGLTVNDKFFWYSHMNPRLVTSNRFNRVWLAIQFGADPEASVFAPLDPVVLKAVEKLPIAIENRKALDYVLTHKRNAFAQIYNSGTFTVFED